MDSRERVFLALDHQEPDRVPRDFWATKEIVDRLKEHLGLADKQAIWDHFDVDIRYIQGPKYTGPELKVFDDGSVNDIWGVPRILRTTGTEEDNTLQSYWSVTEYPLSDVTEVEQLEDYHYWPNPDWFDYSVVYEQARAVREQKRVCAFMGDRLNRFAQLKPAMYLRGIDQALVDMVIEKDVFNAITERLTRFYNEYLTRITEASKGLIDIMVTGDDFGHQASTLCSPDMWKDMLKDGFRNYIELAHQSGAKVMHHTCGSIYSLIPEFIDCKLDILQALQPDTHEMDFDRIKNEFGDKLCFQGSVGIQKALPFGTPEEVRQEVKDRIEALAPGGGFIISTSHNIQGDTQVENVMALIEAYDEFSSYS